MSITNELREFAPHLDIGKVALAGWKEGLLAIADRIDAEHQKAKDEWKAKDGQSWLHGYEECRVELMEGNEVVAASLEEAGWYLVFDADGEIIHVGDRMEHIDLGYVCEVIAVGADCFIAWNTHANRYCQYDVTLFRHHHEPTVEDVLDEFASAYDRIGGEDEEHQKYLDLIAEYATKLQLKERE